MVALLEALVRVPSENPPGVAYPETVAILADATAAIGLTPHLIPIDTPSGVPPRVCLEAFHGSGGPTLYLHGHYDVVPAQAREQFEPRVEGDTLFGRGASDMKSGLVSMLFAVKALRELQVPLAGRVGLCFVPDEETGGRFGSAALASRGLLGRDAVGMILGEPTSGVVWNANRGAVTVDVTVRGRPAHVGLQHQGINAFEHAVEIVGELVKLKAKYAARRTDFRIQPDAARGSILLIGGRVEAGTNFNVVPERCTFTVDRRPNPEEDFELERRELLDVFEGARAQGIRCEIDVFQEGHPSATSERDPLALALADAIGAVCGERPAFEMCPGLLELRFYAQRGIPALAYGPGILAVSHGPQEFVRLERLIECAAVYAMTAATRLQADG